MSPTSLSLCVGVAEATGFHKPLANAKTSFSCQTLYIHFYEAVEKMNINTFLTGAGLQGNRLWF